MSEGHLRAMFSKRPGMSLGSIEMDGFASFRTIQTGHDHWYSDPPINDNNGPGSPQ